MLWVNKNIADDTNKQAVVCNHICTRNAINVLPVTIRTERNWIIPASLSEFTLIWWMHVQNPPGWCALLWMCCSSIICLFEATQKSQENVLPIVDSLSQQGKAWLKCLGHFSPFWRAMQCLALKKCHRHLSIVCHPFGSARLIMVGAILEHLEMCRWFWRNLPIKNILSEVSMPSCPYI